MQDISGEDKTSFFKNYIKDASFPCVGAKSALARDQIEFFIAGDMRSDKNDAAITMALQDFALLCTPESLFVSFAVIFEDTPGLNEAEFEKYL